MFMSSKSTVISSAIGLLLLILVWGSIFVLPEGKQALVLEFGRHIRTVQKPGLHFKVPVIQDVVVLDARLLSLEVPAEEVIASDQKRLVVNIFIRYRIVDPLRFYQAVRTENVANSRLQAFLIASLSRIMGRFPMASVLSPRRVELMDLIQKDIDIEAKGLGIAIGDVRIIRTDLPTENSEAIYKRMNSERQREAQEIRSTGREMYKKIEAEANKQQTVIVATAHKNAQAIKAEGDKVAGSIYARLHDKAPNLYLFLRSLEAYKAVFQADDTTYVISPDAPNQDFFKYYNKVQ